MMTSYAPLGALSGARQASRSRAARSLVQGVGRQAKKNSRLDPGGPRDDDPHSAPPGPRLRRFPASARSFRAVSQPVSAARHLRDEGGFGVAESERTLRLLRFAGNLALAASATAMPKRDFILDPLPARRAPGRYREVVHALNVDGRFRRSDACCAPEGRVFRPRPVFARRAPARGARTLPSRS